MGTPLENYGIKKDRIYTLMNVEVSSMPRTSVGETSTVFDIPTTSKKVEGTTEVSNSKTMKICQVLDNFQKNTGKPIISHSSLNNSQSIIVKRSPVSNTVKNVRKPLWLGGKSSVDNDEEESVIVVPQGSSSTKFVVENNSGYIREYTQGGTSFSAVYDAATNCTIISTKSIDNEETILSNNSGQATDTQNYSCSFCGKSFAKKRYLDRHESRHVKGSLRDDGRKCPRKGMGAFPCSICGKKFANGNKRKRHETSHARGNIAADGDRRNKKPLLKCSICSKTFAYDSTLKIHEEMHRRGTINRKGLKPKCTSCGKNFHSLHHLKTHLESHVDGTLDRNGKRKKEEESFPCRFCDKVLKRLSGRIIHERSHKGLQSQANIMTPVQETPIEGTTSIEVNSSSGGNTTLPEKQLSSLEKLHWEEPTQEKPKGAKCDLCGKIFRNRYKLRKHTAAHKRGTLTSDGSRVPLVGGKKRHKDLPTLPCHICGKNFHSEFFLLEHHDAHSRGTISEEGERLYALKSEVLEASKCSFCGKTIHHKGNLKSHEDAHLRGSLQADGSVKRNNSNKRQGVLKVASKREETPAFRCSFCAKVICNKWNLRSHEAAHRRRNLPLVGNLNKDSATVVPAVEAASFETVDNGVGWVLAPTLEESVSCNCSFCGKVMQNKGNLRNHEDAHRRGSLHPNGSVIKSRKKKVIHKVQAKPTQTQSVELLIPSKKYSCDVCNSEFEDFVDFQVHKREHSDGEGRLACDRCDFSSLFMLSLKKHIMKKHGIATGKQLKKQTGKAGEKRWVCSRCSKSFQTEKSCRLHERIHLASDVKLEPDILRVMEETVLACEKCSFTTGKKHILNKHVKNSHGSKKFFCLVCVKAFSRKSHRDRHELIHQRKTIPAIPDNGTSNTVVDLDNEIAIDNFNEKVAKENFKCDFCDFHASNRLLISQHILEAHTNTDLIEIYFKCDMCPFKTKHRTILQTHKTTAHRKDNFRCEICDKDFHSQTTLKYHQKMHVSEAKKCDLCDFTTRFASALRRHRNCHEEIKHFKCGECGVRYRLATSLERHSKMAH